MKSKQGQFYIFLSLLLIFFIASLRSSSLSSSPQDSLYASSRKNFFGEVGYVLNSALYNQTDYFTTLDIFFRDYQEFLLVQNANLTAIFFLADGQSIYIRNYYPSSMSIAYLNESAEITIPIDYFTIAEIPRVDTLELTIVGPVIDEVYTVSFNEDVPIDLQVVYKFV